jgi:hypothetical protein
VQATQNIAGLARRYPKAFAALSAIHIAKGYAMYTFGQFVLQWLAFGADDDDKKTKDIGHD